MADSSGDKQGELSGEQVKSYCDRYRHIVRQDEDGATLIRKVWRDATKAALSSCPPVPNPLIAYIDALFVSGNAVPVTSTLFGIESWEVIKECLRDGLPLDYNVVEAECVYRRKLAAYGDETRATSPLKKLRDAPRPEYTPVPDAVPADGDVCERLYEEARTVARSENPVEADYRIHQTALVNVYAAGQRSITRKAPPSASAPTPRTDAIVKETLPRGGYGEMAYHAMTELARQLERESEYRWQELRQRERALDAALSSIPALTDHQIARLEQFLIGPGQFPDIAMNTYCKVCGNNVTIGCLPNCAWDYAKKALTRSARQPAQEKP